MTLDELAKKLADTAYALRQVGRIQYGRIFGSAPPSSGRYKAMMDVFEKLYFLRAEVNALTKLLIDKGVFTEVEYSEQALKEYAFLLAKEQERWPEVEFRPGELVIKDTAAFQQRCKAEGWPP